MKSKYTAPSNLRLTIFLFLFGIISPTFLWANDFAPPCDTVVLVSGEIIIVNIKTENNTGIAYNPCNETSQHQLNWNEIKDVHRWINPQMAKRKAARKKAAKERVVEQKIAKSNKEQVEKNTIQLSEIRKDIRAVRKANLPTNEQIIEKIGWRVALSVGNMAFTHLGDIDKRFLNQGFSTDEPEGWFDFVAYDRIPRHRIFFAFDIRRKIKPTIFVGLKSTLAQQDIYAYKASDYTTSSPSHRIEANLDYFSFDPMVEWVSLGDPVSFYVGPSFSIIKDSRFNDTKLNIGLVAGAGIFIFKKKIKMLNYGKIFIELNIQNPYWFRGETIRKLSYDNEIVTSTFDGLSISFNHFKIGIATGIGFKNKKQ